MSSNAPPRHDIYPKPTIDLGDGYTAPPKANGGKALTAAECGIFGPEVKRGEARVDRPVTEDTVARQRSRVSTEVLSRIMRMIFFLNMTITHAHINEWVIGNLDTNEYQWDTLAAKAKTLISELQRDMFTSKAFKDFVWEIVVHYQENRTANQPCILTLAHNDLLQVFAPHFSYQVCMVMMRPLQQAIDVHVAYEHDDYTALRDYMNSLFLAAAQGIFKGTKQKRLRPNDVAGFLNTKQVYANVREVVSQHRTLPTMDLLPVPHGFSNSRIETIRPSGNASAWVLPAIPHPDDDDLY